MQCLICGKEVSQFDDLGLSGHLFITKSFKDDHIHIHGDLDNKELMQELLEVAHNECKLTKVEAKLEKKEFVFHNRQRIGDMLMFTCAVRDFKLAHPEARVNVISTAAHIFDNNPHIDRTLVATPDNTIKIGPSRLTNSSNRIDWHFANAYRVSIEDALKIHIAQGESRPDIWFTEEEYSAPRAIKDPYWIISTMGEKSWGCKMYPQERWQAFVDQNPDILFVQIGTKEDDAQRLQGKNVIDYIGKTQDKETGIRDLFKLFLNAEGSISLVSFAMHLSGALYKPALVVAGAREPVHFTRFEGHRYLSTDGCLPCSIKACWHCDISKCTNKANETTPKCVDMIRAEDLTYALNQYYIGGRLTKGVPSAKPKLANIVKAKTSTIAEIAPKCAQICTIVNPDSKYIKLVSTARGWGGCARSITTIMKLLVQQGHKVEFVPFRNSVTSSQMLQWLQENPEVVVTKSYETMSEHCDVLLMYADDYVWEFNKPEIVAAFSNINADKKIMMLNYRRGGVGEIAWTKGWDKYMFLNSTQEKELLGVLPGVATKVLPPCTELDEFLKVQPNYNGSLRIVRHSSQGDAKFYPDSGTEINNALIVRKDLTISMIPGPSFIPESDRFKKLHKTDDRKAMAEFLATGNLFWYSLPPGYMDMGPRVILEAMAAGLPILADKWGGAVDRVNEECGWLCSSKEEFLEIIENVSFEELKKKGEAARKRAMEEFTVESWVKEVVG